MKNIGIACSLLLLIMICGCGQMGAGNSVSDLSNKGAVQGRIYDSASSPVAAGKYVPVPGAVITAGAASAVSGADGSYSLSGLPAGEIMVTASAEGFTSQSLTVNSSSVNFYLAGKNYSPTGGSSVITGTIYGLPRGVTIVDGAAFTLQERSSHFTYNSSLYQYTLSQAPDDGETYLFAFYTSQEADTYYCNYYTYTRLNMNSSSQEVNLDFGNSTGSLAVNASLPADYQYPSLMIALYNGARFVNELYWKTQSQEANFVASRLPALQSGDSFGVQLSVTCKVGGETMMKVIARYGVTAGAALNFDLTSVPALFTSGPIDGAALNSNPTFCWQKLSGTNILYYVTLMTDELTPRTIWTGYTAGDSLTLPDSVVLNNGSYKWQLSAANTTGIDLADIGASIAGAYINWGVVSSVKKFSLSK